MLRLRVASLKQTNAVKDVSEGSLIPLRVLVELAIVCTQLNVLWSNVASLAASICHVFFQGTTTTQVGNV